MLDSTDGKISFNAEPTRDNQSWGHSFSEYSSSGDR
jgi:hypothetical protein